MAADRELIVRVIGDDRSLQRMFERDQKAVKKAGNELDAFGGRFAKLNQLSRGGLAGFNKSSALLFGSGAFIGGASAAAALRTSISAASDLNEQISKSQQVFGDSSKEVVAWSETTARAIGTSQEQALGAAGTFGNLFRSIHLGSDQSAEVSRRLVQLAADLASFNNASPEDTLDALRSGLVGEAEPLRRYGVLLSEARVQQEALKETGKDSVKQLTDQDKALARIAIIFRDTATAQGDFARTSGGLANQQRILSAEVKDLEANLGKLLLPGVKLLVGSLADATEEANHLVDGLHAIGEVDIPTIHIPFAFDVGGGGKLGDIFKAALLGAAENAPNLGPLVRGLEVLAATRMDDEVDLATPRLAAQFRASLGGFFQDALDQASKDIPTPTVKGTPGFATGLSPADILGPLITDIPKRLQEALLDVQIATPDSHKALIDVLEKERRSLLDALDDPRLNRDQRIELKQKLRGIEGAISGEKDAIQAAIDQANDKRTAALEDAKRKQDATKQKHLEQLQKIQEAREEEARRAAELLQRQQFRSLGLSAAGDEIVPGVENLSKRLDAALAKIASGDASVGSKLAQHLRLARELIKREGDKLTKDTRDTINGFIQAANDELQKGSKALDVSFRVANFSDKFKNLGLTPEQLIAIRSAFSRVGPGGTIPQFTATGGAFGAAGGTNVAASQTVVNVNGNIVTNDPEKFIRDMERKAQRTTLARTGPASGRQL